uniref:Morphogenetic protein n=1 Tax=viral metagenome TaxID=1070528 RepID=A0A6M3JNU8_9ZZZZ
MSTQVKERPILFSGNMIKAILENRKCQTRRVIKPQAHHYSEDVLGQRKLYPCSGPDDFGDPSKAIGIPWAVGDRLWVRETWWDRKDRLPQVQDLNAVHYGDWEPPKDMAYMHYRRPSIHMPRWAARLFLTVKAVRVERLQDISEADARAEGYPDDSPIRIGPFLWFRGLWDSLNAKKPGCSWSDNPWIWCLSFQRIAI